MNGIQGYSAGGQLVFDSSAIGGIFVEKVVIPIGASGSKTYDTDERLQGRALRCIQSGSGSHNWSVDSNAGYPRLNWTSKATGLYSRQTELLVFAA